MGQVGTYPHFHETRDGKRLRPRACTTRGRGPPESRNYPRTLSNISSLKPTTVVFPTRIVGARRFPVGPSIFSTTSDIFAVFISKTSSFLPFATRTFEDSFAMALASFALSLRLAGISSEIETFLASRNLDARVQLVQPFRK